MYSKYSKIEGVYTMKKTWLCLIAVLVLAVGLSIGVSASEESHPHQGAHCVCGGGAVGVGDHTQCENIEWTPLSQALKAAGCTMTTADFGKLPSGNYYLDGDVTVTGTTSLGSKSDSLATTADKTVSLSICLNGYNITRAKGKIFGYLHMGSTLNICDCSYTDGVFGGTVSGGTNNYGSLIYTYSNSVLNIYGGNFTGQANTNGGTIVVACDGCGDVNGNGEYTEADRGAAAASVMNLYNGHITGSTVSATGGTIQLFHTAKLNLYGGTVVGGTAGTTGGAISANKNCTVTVSGGRVVGGTCAKGTEVVQVIGSDGTLLGTYTTFAEGLAKAQNAADCYLQLINDVTAADTVSGTLYLDLNGNTLQGITITGTLYGMDSTTNSYDDSAAGKLIPASGAPQKHIKTAKSQIGAVRSYLTVEQNGAYSFHRFYVGITKVTLKPGTVGVGYKATFAGGEAVASALSEGIAFGYKLWLTEDRAINKGYSAAKFERMQELTLRIDNFLDPDATLEENAQRAEMDVYAVAYIRLDDGTQITGEQVSYDLHRMVELADNAYAGYTTAQQNALSGLSAQFSEIMLGWDIENIHHADGGIWEEVDAAAFEKKLTLRSGSQYNIAAGSYVLTEDIDLGNKKLRVNAGTTVSICLNGHTVTTTNRLFEQYGTLNICDCHDHAQEGSVVSSQAGETATYASFAYCRYNSVTNLYGGHLKATGKVTSAGVIALSHDGGTSNASKPAAVMNMYGGSVSGGQVYENGGLISIWNNASFNMYGGELYGGTADGRGGAIDANSGTINIAGGKIYDNTALYGGGAYLSGRNLTVNIIGGQITDNTATTGAGVYLNNTGASFSGEPQIIENADDNLYMNGGAKLDLSGLTGTAQIGVYTDCTTVIGEDLAVAAYLISDNSAYAVRQVYGKVLLMAQDMTAASPVSGFNVGFGQMCIDPETIDGMPLAGFSNPTERLAVSEGREEYDKLMAQSVAITDENGQTVILIFCDLITASSDFINSVVPAVSAATNVPQSNIFINCSHSHSVPSVSTTSVPAVVEYNKTLPDLFARSALQAMNDRQPATMETGSFEVVADIDGKGERYLNFYRHYSYEEDGIVKYFGDQFGDATYNSTTQHVRDADHTMHLVRFTRDGKDILMSNWRIHPHRTGGETKYLMSSDVIGTLRYYMAQELPDTHFVYFQGAAGNVNSTSRLSAYNHGLDYVKYGQVLAQCIVSNLDCLESREIGLLQIDHYDYVATADVPSDEEYAKAKAVYDLFVVETEGMSLSQKNQWVRDYCAENPEYDFVSGFQLSFIVNRRYNQKDTVLPLNVVTLGKSFGFFTAPGEMWDSVSMAVEEATQIDTVFCIGYSMAHQHYFVYYPEYADEEDGVPYVSYESENRHFVAPDTIQDMVDYWTDTLNEFYNNN